MIRLSRLNGTEVYLNADLVATVESHHDTVITLVDGKTWVVLDRPEEVVDAVRTYRASVIAAAAAMPLAVPDEAPEGPESGARLLVLRPTSDSAAERRR